MHITYKEIKQNERINQYIRKADESALIALGFTEHSFPHVTRVAEHARRILLEFRIQQPGGPSSPVSPAIFTISEMW